MDRWFWAGLNLYLASFWRCRTEIFIVRRYLFSMKNNEVMVFGGISIELFGLSEPVTY